MTTPSIEISELLRSIDGGEPLVLLDVRNDEDVASWRIEGRRDVETVHVPYFAFLEELDASLARLPRERPIVALCAKGGSSAMVVELLRDAGLDARNVAGGMAAYGDHLEAQRVPLAGSASEDRELWQVVRRGKGCLSYVVRAGREALVVDPSRRGEWYEAFVAGLGARIVRVLDTHVHADHLSGGPALASRLGVPYSAGAGQASEMQHLHEPLADGSLLRWGPSAGADSGRELRVIATPGHTPGSASFLIDGRALLSGDTLFVRGVGRPDLGGKAEEWGRALFRTLHHGLAELPDAVLVLPAHGAGLGEARGDGVFSTTLGEIRRAAEFKIQGEQDFVESLIGRIEPAPEAYAAIVRANLGQSRPEPDQAIEWELGMNRCAASGSLAKG